jgi:hypothetical protein
MQGFGYQYHMQGAGVYGYVSRFITFIFRRTNEDLGLAYSDWSMSSTSPSTILLLLTVRTSAYKTKRESF